MNKILTIAFNTYKEAVRNKVFYILFFFAILLLLLSLILATLALGQDDRIIKDVGLTAINLFGLLLAIFVGVNLVFEELDKRTIYTIIASGVSRSEFIIGKYLGFFMTVVVNVLLMGVMLCALTVIYPNSSLSASLVIAIIMFLFEMMIIAAFAVLFSSFSTPVLSALLTFMCWIIGHFSEDLWEWARRLSEQGSESLSMFLKSLYFIVPNLELYNLKNQVVHQEDLGSLSGLIFFYPFAAILYTAILLSITILSFKYRDFK